MTDNNPIEIPPAKTPGRKPTGNAKLSVGFRVPREMVAFLRGLDNQNAYIESIIRSSSEFEAWSRKQLLDRIRDL